MAKVKFGTIVSDARGAVGGSIFSRNFSGPYVKSNAMPVNARTLKSLSQRALFGALSSCWRTLSEAQWNMWRTTAGTLPQQNSMGETFYYTGFQLFMKYNNVLAGLGISSIITEPQAAPSWPTIITSTSQVLIIGDDWEGILALTINATPMTDPLTQFSLEIFVTPYVSQGIRIPKESWFRRVGYYSDWGNETQYTDSFMSAVGGWIDGNWMFVRLYLVNELGGQKTLFYETTVTDLTPPP